jgi:hypothetical protein
MAHIDRMPEVPNIALRAYQLWNAAGRPDGRSDEFWFQAEEEFLKMLEVAQQQDVAEET